MKVIKTVGKILISALLAFVVLNLFALLYYNVPSRVEDSSSSADYKWESNAFYSRATEGFSAGTINNDGFNNCDDYVEGMNIDNLLMGSSQGEGFCIDKKNTISSVLNDISDSYTYSICVSEHTLPICVSNLESALEKYNPEKYVIIETMTSSFYDEEILEGINDNTKLPVYSGKLMSFLQNFKYLKLLYYQLYNSKQLSSSNKVNEPINNKELLNELLSKANDVCEKNGVKLVIVYHPVIMVDNDNTISTYYNKEDLEILYDVCNNNDIIFINMEEDFIDYYYMNNILPYGFNNTTPGLGHLNKYGHYLIAQKLKEVVEG